MTLLAIISFSLSLSLSLTLTSSPLFLGLWILFLAMGLSLFLSFISFHWLGLFMFIIYIGGLLVMFSYFVALAPNQVIEGKLLILSMLFTFLLLIGAFLFFSYLSPNLEFFNFFSNSYISAFFFFSNFWSLFFMALMLFFALVAVVKISSSNSGPLRPFSS